MLPGEDCLVARGKLTRDITALNTDPAHATKAAPRNLRNKSKQQDDVSRSVLGSDHGSLMSVGRCLEVITVV